MEAEWPSSIGIEINLSEGHPRLDVLGNELERAGSLDASRGEIVSILVVYLSRWTDHA